MKIQPVQSYSPASYSHRRPFTTSADRPEIPYLGTPEDTIRDAFENRYLAVAHYFRTPTFHNAYESAGDPFGLVLSHVVHAQDQFQTDVTPTVSQVVGFYAGHESASLAVVQSRQLMAKDISGPTARHVDAAKDLTLDLVTDITAKQLDAIRQAIVDSIAKGVTVQAAAQRISNLVGLFPRWQAAVDNLYQRLLADGMNTALADKRAADYQALLIKRRGTMIARTELIRALNAGRLQGWRESAAKGLFSAALSVKVWLTAPGACPECLEMEGKRVTGVDTLFDSPWGPIIAPPGHPMCRCSLNFILQRDKKPRPARRGK